LNNAIKRIEELLEITLNQINSGLKSKMMGELKQKTDIQPTASPLVQKMQAATQRKTLRAANSKRI
jgi:hypothetical protein